MQFTYYVSFKGFVTGSSLFCVHLQAREKGVKKQDAEQKLMNDLDAIEKVRV